MYRSHDVTSMIKKRAWNLGNSPKNYCALNYYSLLNLTLVTDHCLIAFLWFQGVSLKKGPLIITSNALYRQKGPQAPFFAIYYYIRAFYMTFTGWVSMS